MDIKTTLKAINEMVKQYDNLGEDTFREKSIYLVRNTFNIEDIYRAEILFDLAYHGDGVYLTDTDDEIEYKIELDGDWIKAKKIYDTDPIVYDWKSCRINDLLVLLDDIDGKIK